MILRVSLKSPSFSSRPDKLRCWIRCLTEAQEAEIAEIMDQYKLHRPWLSSLRASCLKCGKLLLDNELQDATWVSIVGCWTCMKQEDHTYHILQRHHLENTLDITVFCVHTFKELVRCLSAAFQHSLAQKYNIPTPWRQCKADQIMGCWAWSWQPSLVQVWSCVVF